MGAEEEVQAGGMPRIGEQAPDFQALTTHGPLNMSDLRGQWVVLFSHPADFTPVCTTEFVAFARRAEEFAKRNVKLVGLSIDSIHSHLAWLRNIEEKLAVKIPFPVIADVDMKVASKFGMIHPEASTTAAVRALFVIDPEGFIQASMYYPLQTGRSIDEVLRLVDALQTTYKHYVATPADWHPGEKVIVPPPLTQEQVEELMRSDYEKIDFYLMKRDL
ncbi:MAG: peroxiredoxin [Dehalococcoidia bacterium SM23_28_2]|nr:MAG: peroxiredoxin [Dehalococcoidia bacterium SM23_28_2]